MSNHTDQKSPANPNLDRVAIDRLAQQLMDPLPYVTETADADNEPVWRCPYCGEENAIVAARIESTCGCGFKVKHIERLEELGRFTYTFLRMIDQAEKLTPALMNAMAYEIYNRVQELGPEALEHEMNFSLIDGCPNSADPD